MALLNYSTADQRRSDKTPLSIRNLNPDRIVDFVSNRVQEAIQGKAYKNLKENYDNYRRAYEGKFKNTSDIPKWRNRLYVRLSFKLVETLRAYFDDAFFGRSPYVYVNPRSASFKNSAKNMEGAMQFYAEKMKKRIKYNHVFNSTLKYGIGITKNTWRFERGMRPVRQFLYNRDGTTNPTGEEEREYVKYDCPDFDIVNPLKVAFDPLNYFTDEMRYSVEEFEVDFDLLWAKRKMYDQAALMGLEKEITGGYTTGGELTGQEAPFTDSDYFGIHGESARGADYTRKRVSITYYEGRLDMPANQEDPRRYQVFVANQKWVLLIRPFPYSFDRPSYNIHQIIPNDESYIGIGAIEPILTDQRILNILMNVRLDSLHLLISPRILAHKNSLEKSLDNISGVAPGGVIGVRSAADLARVIMPLQMPDQGFQTFHQFWELQNRHAEETLAMNANAFGMLAQQKRSATETVRALESANARFSHMVSVFRESGYHDHIGKESSLIQQFMEAEEWVKVMGEGAVEEFRNVQPFDLQGDFQHEYEDPTQTNKDIETQLWINLLSAIAPYMQLLQQANPGMSPVPFIRGILEASPVAKKLDLAKMLPEVSPDAMAFLGSENGRLESALNTPGSAGGSMPGGGMTAGTSPAGPTAQPQQTSMAIAAGGL